MRGQFEKVRIVPLFIPLFVLFFLLYTLYWGKIYICITMFCDRQYIAFFAGKEDKNHGIKARNDK